VRERFYGRSVIETRSLRKRPSLCNDFTSIFQFSSTEDPPLKEAELDFCRPEKLAQCEWLP